MPAVAPAAATAMEVCEISALEYKPAAAAIKLTQTPRLHAMDTRFTESMGMLPQK